MFLKSYMVLRFRQDCFSLKKYFNALAGIHVPLSYPKLSKSKAGPRLQLTFPRMKNIRKAKLLAHQNPFNSTYFLSGQHSVCPQPNLLLIGVGKHIDLLKHYCISVGSALTDISPLYLPSLE